jgi:Zn-finger nucleic acid-binding protein
VASTTQGVRCLVACSECRRQYDATGFSSGSRFHCACGVVVEVPRFSAHDADVVRCSSCSAPRTKSQVACGHCRADYTLHEKDLHTICPSCMTRVSDRARYCHHCATPIAPQGGVGHPTRTGCPACGERHKMNGRSLGDPPISVLECPRCAGMWLGLAVFRSVADRARDDSVADPAMLIAESSTHRAGSPAGPERAFYRQCPECRSVMNRRNFGQRSGVVIDTCKEHGLWFDAQELSGILRWIRQGGETRAKKRQASERRHVERQSRFKVERATQADQGAGGLTFGGAREGIGLGGFLGHLFDL